MSDVFRGLSAEDYATTLSAGLFSDKEARAEYARLRKVANKRLAYLEKRGYENYQVYKRYADAFGSLRGASIETVREHLSYVAHFLGLQTSKIRGQQLADRRYVATMQKRGYDYITEENVKRFGDFMKAAVDHYGDKEAFDSEHMYELYKAADKSAITPEKVAEDFDYWSAHMDKLPMPEMTEEDKVK